MGWLDNSTNNIILDAVLTDFGRQQLAAGNFQINKFSLGDDEVNYDIVTKYGRTIGREKIEKNTPVFEALTNQNLALKYKLVSVPTPIVYMPLMRLQGSATSITSTQNASTTINVQQVVAANDSSSVLEPSLADAAFDVYYPSLFMVVGNNANAPPGQVSLDMLRTAHATVQTTSGATVAGAGDSSRTASFTVYFKSLTSTSFQTYGRIAAGNNNKYQIVTAIKIVGVNSGLVLDIPVYINQT